MSKFEYEGNVTMIILGNRGLKKIFCILGEQTNIFFRGWVPLGGPRTWRQPSQSTGDSPPKTVSM